MTKKPNAKTPKAKPAKKPAKPEKKLKAAPAPKPAEEQEDSGKFNPDDFKIEEHAPRLESKWVEVECPYCGDSIDVRVDPNNEEGQSLIQDCQVCCKPVQITVDVEDGEVDVYASRG